MGGIEAEKGVVKLVHPGRYVEIHKEPITAAQVLKKNPRHSVTRPDVFQYPWIVVRPESVLNLGRVFYIVPNRTIYKLIKAKGYSVQPSLHQNQYSPRSSYVHRQLTPKHQNHCQSHWQQFQANLWEEEQAACCERFNTPFESLADMMTKYQSSYKEFKQILSVTDNSTSDFESLDDKYLYNFREVSSSKTTALKQDDDALALGTILKPCLRKHDSARKLLPLKVSFFLPTKCEER